MASRRSTPGLFELLQEADLSHYYNELRNSLRVCHVQQLKYVNDDDLSSIGMSKAETQRLKNLHTKYCPPNYVSKLKKLLLPSWSKDEFLLDDEASETVPSPPSTTFNKSMPLPTLSSMEAVVHHQGVEIKVPRQHLISPESIQIYKELGTGEFGVVQQGVWIDCNQVTHQVAIKSLSKERMHNSTVEFMKEYEIMQTIEHHNIVRLFGVVLESSRIMIITELAPLRSLLECLKEPNLRTTLTVPCLAGFAQNICGGMKYLESRRLIHRDLAARNILVFSRHVVKISDFGLSRALGVGKDYYQTNFNMNLKLPIAWCAPECITFLKFTSASDIWAFGVTMWEMFSYGFQPWAAQTGQQILEAIDEPNHQRLEKPLYCPTEHYNAMQKCWSHEPTLRPTFAQLCSILDEAKPEQVRATSTIMRGPGHHQMNLLEFEVGHVITILDKYDNNTSAMWSGIRDDNGHVGMFSPSQTVTYLGTIPKSVSSYMTVQTQPSYQTSTSHSRDASYSSNDHFSVFQRSSLKTDSKKRLSREMISAPQDFQNVKGHMDAGSHFGSQPRLTRLSRADSDTSELAPLITRSSINASHHQQSKPANRMGHTIGYIRERSSTNQSLVGAPSTFIAHAGDHSSSGKTDKHEYHSISDHEDEEDDAFFKPLDLGPSLLDEVFQELESSSAKAKESQLPAHPEEVSKKSDTMKDFKGLVNSTLNMRRHKKKQLATVRPIKASDERAIESAIAMANALASKSMHDLDTRSMEPFYEHSPGRSPMTPNSPSKKFSFFFPSTGGGGAKSPKVERKPFTDEAKTTGDLTSCLSTGEKDAYRALVGESESLPPLSKLSPPSSLTQSMACLPVSYMNTLPADHFMQMSPPPSHPPPPCPSPSSNNLLPLPPKSHSFSRGAHPAKRHVRKNPLIVPSAMVSNLIRNENVPNIYCNSPAAPQSMQQQAAVAPVLEDFENDIAQNIDALEDIVGEGAEDSLFTDEPTQPDQRDVNSDEVRIMMKVMGSCVQAEDCLSALNLTQWNIHHAIKLVKLKNLIKVNYVSDNEMLATLHAECWDVAKTAGYIMKRLQ